MNPKVSTRLPNHVVVAAAMKDPIRALIKGSPTA
ncbi:hypothetical protein VCR31J2_1360036 [Vibrio coralliirubri]|uniref:Uncharacterized protein n=1 Tax=Vibrio coralliirubri TaxID=1516159 RepID=A0AA87C0T7_9VIBR|nr:hypothetical protein VCR31J2_1360036 [Vibrio coralliirubri]